MRVYFDYVISFWVSIGLLSLCQGIVVFLPRAFSPAPIARLRSRLWGLVPALSVVVFVAVGLSAEDDNARALTYLALVGVPLLAALALGWVVWSPHPPRPRLALLVAPLFALAWVDHGGLVGEGAAVALSALSCVALGSLIASVTPTRWLALGIVAMACADAALVISHLLQAPNNALNAARPVGGLPRLQAEVFGSAVMGYGDLFVAGLLGGLLACLPPAMGGACEGAVTSTRSRQLTGALLVAGLAVAFDFLFFAVSELPATVPVASALVILAWAGRRHDLSWRGARPPQKAPAPGAAAPR